MSTAGRGRGYTGRHHLRETKPGDSKENDIDTSQTITETSPRVAESEKKRVIQSKMEKLREREIENEEDCNDVYLQAEDDAALKELLTVDEQFRPLLVLLEQFSLGEDGIQFNRKLRHFETTVTGICPDETSLRQVFATFRAAALTNSGTARKLAAVGASFTRQQRQQLLRRVLLDVVMEGTFSKIEVLERASPVFLINAANLLGDYFAEARLSNGNKVQILASPLLQYMRALLASDDIRAHRSLATQLMQNGRELLTQHTAQELEDLSISVRLRLLTPPPVSIVWLLLSADLCLNKFLPLPNTLQQFYASHLELATSEDNYSEVSYGSWKKSPEKEELRLDVSTDSTTEQVGHNLSSISLNNDGEPKKLRPILGAGAGLLRQEQATANQDIFDTWTSTSKSNLAKRYDLNSWRQSEEEKEEPVFNPSVLPPNMQTYTVPIPDYPPPRVQSNYPENAANYLQQGDGTYIQNQFQPTNNFNQQGDSYHTSQIEGQERQTEKVNNEIQKNAQSKKPVENWRREKSDLKEDSNRNRQRNWTRQRSKDNVDDDEEKSKDGDWYRSAKNSKDQRPANRLNRRSSTENERSTSPKAQIRRHVTDVPRNHRYWDHDDRCDKDYNS
ncbi:hypothetical protein ACJJTC_011023 [Scirpophaga incertulas]